MMVKMWPSIQLETHKFQQKWIHILLKQILHQKNKAGFIKQNIILIQSKLII